MNTTIILKPEDDQETTLKMPFIESVRKPNQMTRTMSQTIIKPLHNISNTSPIATNFNKTI